MLGNLRGLALFAAVIGMPLSSYFLVFRPQNNAIKRAREDVAHKQSLLVKLREETARTADLVRANEQVQETLKNIEARLPSNQEIDAVIRRVSELATDSGLDAPAMKAAKPIQAALYMELPLEMEVKGDWKGFRTFLAELEKLPRLKRIPDLKLTSLNKLDGSQLRADFTLSIYFQDSTTKTASAEVK